MINFSWTQEEDGSYRLSVRTPVTTSGTLYRLTAAIYMVGLDILSGDIRTVREGDIEYSEDIFLLMPDGSTGQDLSGEISARLGILMESLLSENADPDRMLEENGIRVSPLITFFDNAPEIVFEDLPDKLETRFYIETVNRRGLLYHLTRILAREQINIVSGKVRTSAQGRAEDLLHLQYRGRALGEELAGKIETHIVRGEGN